MSGMGNLLSLQATNEKNNPIRFRPYGALFMLLLLYMMIEDFYKKELENNPDLRKIANDPKRIFYYNVSNLITEARLHKGLTQEGLAKLLNTKQPSISRMERGTSLPSLSFLMKIADALGMDLVAPRFARREPEIID